MLKFQFKILTFVILQDLKPLSLNKCVLEENRKAKEIIKNETILIIYIATLTNLSKRYNEDKDFFLEKFHLHPIME